MKLHPYFEGFEWLDLAYGVMKPPYIPHNEDYIVEDNKDIKVEEYEKIKDCIDKICPIMKKRRGFGKSEKQKIELKKAFDENWDQVFEC